MTERIAMETIQNEINLLQKQAEDLIYTVTSPDFLLAQVGWISQIFLIGLAAFLSSMFIWRLLRRWVATHLDGDLKLRYAVLKAANGPLGAFIWIFALGVMAKVVQTHFGLLPPVNWYIQMAPALYIVMLAWFFVRLNNLMFRDVLTSNANVSAASRDLGQKLGIVLIGILLTIAILPFFGVSVGGLLTVGGVGGLVIGFAAKNAIANYIGSIMLHFDQPFKVGDWVRVREKGVEGFVESIGWRQVVIRDFNTQPVYVPNAMFGTVVVENPDRMTHRRMKFYLNLRHADMGLVPQINAAIKEYLLAQPEFDPDLGITVALEKIAPLSLDVLVSSYTEVIDNGEFLLIQERCLLAIAAIVAKNGGALVNPPVQAIDIGNA